MQKFPQYLQNKQNITWLLGETSFIFSCWKCLSPVRFTHSWEILTALKDWIHIPARPCNILYLLTSPLPYGAFHEQTSFSRGLFLKSPKNFLGPNGKFIFQHVFNKEKPRGLFDGSETRLFEYIKGIVAPEMDPKSFGTFEKLATGTNPARGQYWNWTHDSQISSPASQSLGLAASNN